MTLNSNQVSQLPVSIWGKILFKCVPYRRHIVLKNIDLVFGHVLSSADKIRLAQAFYSHLLTSIKEMIQIRFLSHKKMKEKVDVIGHEYLLKVAEENKGVLIVTGHFGNWEFAPLGGMANFKEFAGRFHFIRRTLGNKTLERILFRRYYKAGLQVIPKRNSLNQVCAALEKMTR